ncbi:MAG: class IV adenylate cyclase [Spirochaetae bacterium HGW-Spirochaetae-1]|jgi:adenylate cyclase class 2|nr:MAG: class IV adenylate cyclase [Spirochaetae bacterium HGW-Spirochaetae-1]
MLEIEIKSPCDGHEKIMARLADMGALLTTTRTEEDLYFNHPARDFRETDEALRIRRIDADSIVTYKGPKLSGRAKTRLEVETAVESFQSMRDILEHLGFVSSGSVLKERKIYHLKDVEVCLDSVQGLGTFVELEKMGEDRERIEDELFGLAARLGLESFERRSYLEMVLEAGK